MKYPVEAIKEGIQGRVIVEVIIEKNGEVGDVSVLESADLLLAQEAVRVVKASPKWKPAKIGTQPVRTRISIPIEFRLKR
jgi:TonB family protein